MRHGMTVVLLLLGLSVPPSTSRAGSDAAAAVPRPLPDDRLGIQTAPLLLLSRNDVRADLGLSPEQASAAEVEISDLYSRALPLEGAARRAGQGGAPGD